MSGQTNEDTNQNTNTKDVRSNQSVTDLTASTSGDSGSDKGSDKKSNDTNARTTLVYMPEDGLTQLAEITGRSVDELYELNRDILPNKLSFTVGQQVRIPA